MNIKFLYTTTDEWESKLIRFGTGSSCSHFAFQFDDMVFHAYNGKVRYQPLWEFLASPGMRVVYEQEPRKQHKSLNKVMLNKLRLKAEGRSYDFNGVTYLGWRMALKKFMNVALPKKNKTNSKEKWFCTELAGIVAEEMIQYGVRINADRAALITPEAMRLALKKSKRVDEYPIAGRR